MPVAGRLRASVSAGQDHPITRHEIDGEDGTARRVGDVRDLALEIRLKPGCGVDLRSAPDDRRLLVVAAGYDAAVAVVEPHEMQGPSEGVDHEERGVGPADRAANRVRDGIA